MRLHRLLIAIDLHQNESGRIVGLLHQIESGYPWLPEAVPRILDGSFNESLHGLGIHVDADMDDYHREVVSVSCWLSVRIADTPLHFCSFSIRYPDVFDLYGVTQVLPALSLVIVQPVPALAMIYPG